METLPCPGCGHALFRVADRGVRQECAACDGQLVGLIPFERRLADGEGRRLWRAADDGQAFSRCPFCAAAMQVPAGEAGSVGIAVCRRCEQVWIPAGAQPWMEAHAARPGEHGAAPGLAHPDECPVCGAPWSPDPAGQCRYCREQLQDDDLAAIAATMLGISGGRASL